MPKNYVRRRYTSYSGKRFFPKKSSAQYGKRKKFPWIALLLLIILVSVLVLIIFYLCGNISSSAFLRFSDRATPKADQSSSGAVVKTAHPVQYTSDQKNKSPKIKFDFYTVLPNTSVEVSDLASNSSNQQNSDQSAYYILQLASFKDVKKANIFQSELKQKGFETKSLLIVQHGVTWYRIQIGPIKNFDQAVQVKQQLQNQNVNSVLLTFKGV